MFKAQVEMNTLFALSLFSLQGLIWIRLPPQPSFPPVQQVTKQLQPSTAGGGCTTEQADCWATNWEWPFCIVPPRLICIRLGKWQTGESAGALAASTRSLSLSILIPHPPVPTSVRWSFPCFSCGVIYPLRLIWREWLTFSVLTLKLSFGWFLEHELV